MDVPEDTESTNSPTAFELVQRVLRTRPAGLLTDIDGTISRIAGHPSQATIVPEARNSLTRLTTRLDLVAAVSGRSVEDARRIVGLDSIVYSGNHGMEIWRNGQLEQSRLAAEHSPRIRQVLGEIEAKTQIDGVYFENKGLTGSIHVRETSDPDSAERTVLENAQRLSAAYDVVVTRGRRVIEIRPPVTLSKGTAVRALIEEYQLRAAFYLGDDMTDVDAFLVLQQLRADSSAEMFAIGVDDPATPREVLDNADALVNGVEGVVELLQFIETYGDQAGDD